jgi:hypothetical protein
MINPTTSAGSQFTSPFDILPNVVYTNPTGINSAQFTAPYSSGQRGVPIFNPTNGGSPQAAAQFTAPFNLLPDPTFANPTQNNTQFTEPFNILPDIILPNPTLLAKKEQFSQEYNTLSDIKFPSPLLVKPLEDASLENADKLDANPLTFSARNWTAGTAPYTNVSLKTTANNIFGFASLAGASYLGIPQIGQVGEALLDDKSLSGTYTTLPFDKLTTKLFPSSSIQTPVLYPDFRSRMNIDNDANVGGGPAALAYLTSRRLDGASALLRGSVKAGIYAAAAVSPVGPYSIFNLDGAGTSGYGWGEHDNQYAIRKDFTMRSHIAKTWRPGLYSVVPSDPDVDVTFGYDYTAGKGKYDNTINPIEMATPFRGDKVSVIDFGARRLHNAYLWKPSLINKDIFGLDLNKFGLTQDFIKFYFTGPKLQAGNTLDTDDIIVFRATLTNLGDSFNANWTPVNMIGRADPNYIYTGFSRDLSISFDIYATDRDEMQPIYRKLNALAGYTAPTYDPETIAMEGPWMRITIGDLFNQTPVVLNSVSYDYGVSDAPWEINIENDPNMMQVPFKISVTLSMNVVSDYLPQKGGRFYTLAKRFAAGSGTPLTGNDNWLSDTKGNLNAAELRRRFKTSKSKVKGTKVGKNDLTETTLQNTTNTFGEGIA